MCAIIELLPGMSLPYFYIDNVVNNNEDGYGLVIKHKDSLEVIKACPENGTDPLEIQKLLDENKKYLRYLHLRHKTEGEISLENCHPYNCYDEKGIQIEFMHNGTMYEFAPKKEIKTNGVITQEADNRSDSKIFVDTVLKPLFQELKVPDYTGEFAKKFIGKMWPVSTNRGLIISNRYPTMILDGPNWKTIEITDALGAPLKFRASNDDYFQEIKRGRVFEENKRKREAEEAAKRANSTFRKVDGQTGVDWPLTALKDINFKPNQFLGVELCDIQCDYDLHTDIGVASLANLSEAEILYLTENDPKEAAALMVLVTGAFGRLFKEITSTELKHSEASKLIAKHAAKINTLEGIIAAQAKELGSLKGKVLSIPSVKDNVINNVVPLERKVG